MASVNFTVECVLSVCVGLWVCQTVNESFVISCFLAQRIFTTDSLIYSINRLHLKKTKNTEKLHLNNAACLSPQRLSTALLRKRQTGPASFTTTPQETRGDEGRRGEGEAKCHHYLEKHTHFQVFSAPCENTREKAGQPYVNKVKCTLWRKACTERCMHWGSE